MTQGMLDLPDGQHVHLRLTRQVITGPRVTGRGRGAPDDRFPDQPRHARQLRADITQLRAIHAKRHNVLGVNPENVVVLTFSGRTPPEQKTLNTAGLTVLDWFPDRVVVTSNEDPELSGLVERLDLYQQGPRPAAETGGAVPGTETTTPQDDSAAPATRTARYQALFDRIEHIRGLTPDEILTDAAIAAIEAADPNDVLTLDLQCWCPEEADEAQFRHTRTRKAVEQGGGTVLDATVRHRSGLSLIRVDVTAELARTLADLPDVRRIDQIPRPVITQLEATTWGADHLPPVLPPDPNSPLIAVVDSGVRSSHPLLASAFSDAMGLAGLEADHDGSGHGTFVASLALHGSLEPLLERPREPIRPAGRLLSIRVLGENNAFARTDLWENDLMWALTTAADQGARVINLSVGDPRRPYSPARPTPLAATVDEFVRRSGVVVVISTGNMAPADYDNASLDTDDFTRRLLDSDDSGLLDPATSALALTVGALGADEGQGVRLARALIDQEHLGGEDVPSPFTRKGPGAGEMIKPEAVMPGGHLVRTHTDRYPRTSPATSVIGANGVEPVRLLASDAGTSYAAPLVTHVAATAMGANPTLSGRAVRALVLASIEPVDHYLMPVTAANGERERHLTGYGRPHASRAAYSSDHRAVLVAEESLQVDNVHLYVVPIPSSFFSPGGLRRVTASLAFDPETRSTRLDYLASRLEFHIYRGVTVDQVADAYYADRQNPKPVDFGGAQPDDAQSEGPASLAHFRLDLQPPPTYRSRGAHVYGTYLRRTRLEPGEGSYLVVAVQSMNRWRANAEAFDDYALCLVLERDLDHDEVYADLRAQLEVRVPIEIESPVQIEV